MINAPTPVEIIALWNLVSNGAFAIGDPRDALGLSPDIAEAIRVAHTAFTVFVRRRCVRYPADVPFPEPDPEFAEVQRELAETLSKLAVTDDSNGRRLLLREMRRLLAEADRVVDPQTDASK